MRATVLLGLMLIAMPDQAQVVGSPGRAIPCSVRIRAAASADYDFSHEFVLRGRVVATREGSLSLRLPVGVVRVEVGRGLSVGSLQVNQVVEVVASRQQDDQHQWFVAREIRAPHTTFILRNALGVPNAL